MQSCLENLPLCVFARQRRAKIRGISVREFRSISKFAIANLLQKVSGEDNLKEQNRRKNGN